MKKKEFNKIQGWRICRTPPAKEGLFIIHTVGRTYVILEMSFIISPIVLQI